MNHRDWMDHGTSLFLGAVDKLGDSELDEPSRLPGWSRRHVIAHVHFNAEALRRLLSWARTGAENRMYADARQRAAEIEQGAGRPAAALRALVRESARELGRDMDTLPESGWQHMVVTARRRSVPASEIPWMRTREVAVHAVDLRGAAGFGDLPAELNIALAADAVRSRSDGEAAAVAEWLTGRSAEAPVLGPWL